MGTQAAGKSMNTVVLEVSGMTCGGCVNAVEHVLSGVAGVSGVRVDLSSGCATVTGTAEAGVLIRAIEGAGFGARIA